MPYRLDESGRCVVDDAGTTVPGGCHDTHADAVDHLRALMANVDEARTAALSDRFPLDPDERWFFEMPDWFKPGMKLTVITDGPEAGRLAASLAARGTYILSGLGPWKSPPSPSGYEEAMQGDTVTASGRVVKTANLAADIDHVNERASFRQARDAMANTGTQLARVRFYDVDGYTIALGAAWPGLSDLQVRKMQASALSGHWTWREEYGGYDCAGAIFCNSPALPLPDRPVFQPLALAASLDVAHPPVVGGWVSTKEEAMSDEPTVTLTLTASETRALHELLHDPARTAAVPAPVPEPEAPAAGGDMVSREEFDALVARLGEVEAELLDRNLADVDAMMAALPESLGGRPAAKYTPEELQAMADRGEVFDIETMAYPVGDCEDVTAAVADSEQEFGGANTPDDLRGYIVARAEQLGCLDAVPQDWQGLSESVATAEPVAV